VADFQVQVWDSSVFITLFEGRDQERVDVIRTLLRRWDRGLQIVVSTMAIAEVRRIRLPGAEGPGPGHEDEVVAVPWNEDARALVRDLFASDQLIVRPVLAHIADLAADIGNEYPALMPTDCIHIATALDIQADVLFTYDGATMGRRRIDAMLRYDGRIGLPPLAIREPFDPWPDLGL
jgi:predicted nucleic acid-binding protein